MGRGGLFRGWGLGPAGEAVSDTGVRDIPCRWTRLPISSEFSPGYAPRVARSPDPTAFGLRGSDPRGCPGSPRLAPRPRTLCMEGNACHLVVFFCSCKSVSRPTPGQIHTFNGSFAAGMGTHILKGFLSLFWEVKNLAVLKP